MAPNHLPSHFEKEYATGQFLEGFRPSLCAVIVLLPICELIWKFITAKGRILEEKLTEAHEKICTLQSGLERERESHVGPKVILKWGIPKPLANQRPLAFYTLIAENISEIDAFKVDVGNVVFGSQSVASEPVDMIPAKSEAPIFMSRLDVTAPCYSHDWCKFFIKDKSLLIEERRGNELVGFPKVRVELPVTYQDDTSTSKWCSRIRITFDTVFNSSRFEVLGRERISSN